MSVGRLFSRGKKMTGLQKEEARAAYLFILPVTLGLLVFTFLPILYAFRVSFQDFQLLSPVTPFVGLDNYRAILNDPLFFISMRNTLVYTAMVVVLLTLVALGLAILVKQEIRGVGFFRTAYFIPVVTSLVVVSTVWKLIYNSNGLLNSILREIGIGAQPLLNSTTQALPALAVMAVWKEVGFAMLILLGGMQAISQDIYDAAKIDGANRLQGFWYITLPLLRRVMLFVVVITTIAGFKAFTSIYIMTSGGPADSTNVIVFHIFREAFRYYDMGYASALSFVLLLIVLVITLVQFRLLRSEVEY